MSDQPNSSEMADEYWNNLNFFKPLLLVIALCFVFPSHSAAMGDPLFNLRGFFTDLFRVQIDNPETILRGSDMQLGNTPPSNIEKKRALHIKTSTRSDIKSLSCDDIVFLGYNDWLAGFEKARYARSRAQDNLVTSEMIWPNFWNWNSPVFAIVSTRRTLLGNLKSVSASIAALGNDWNISDIINHETHKFTESALQLVFSVKGRGYDSLYEFQMSSRNVVLSGSLECNGFTIFNIEAQ